MGIEYTDMRQKIDDLRAINVIGGAGQTIAGTISGLEGARDQCYIASNATTEELGRVNNLLNETTTQVAYAEKLIAKGVKAELSADSQAFIGSNCKETVGGVNCTGLVKKEECDTVEYKEEGKIPDWVCSWGNHNLEGSLSPNLLGFFNNVCTELGYGFVCKLPIYEMEGNETKLCCEGFSCEWELSL